MGNPTVRAWQLGRAQARFRKAAGLTQKQAAEILECSQSRIAQIEDGKLPIKKTELDYLLRAYGADVAEIAQLEQLRIEVERGERGWWAGLPEWLGGFMGLEEAAARIRAVEVSGLVPGLFQTEAYAREQHEIRGALTPTEIDARVAARLQRQVRLTSAVRPVELTAVVSQAALDWCKDPGDEIGAAQLRYLYERAQLPNVELRILAYRTGRNSGMQGSYSLLSYEDKALPEVAWYEHALGGRVIDDEPAIASLTRLFDQIRGQALDANDSLTMLADLINTLH